MLLNIHTFYKHIDSTEVVKCVCFRLMCPELKMCIHFFQDKTFSTILYVQT